MYNGCDALIIGKEYKVLKITQTDFVIRSEHDYDHYFSYKNAHKFFSTKPPKTNNMNTNERNELREKAQKMRNELDEIERILSEPEVPTIDELVKLYKPKHSIGYGGHVYETQFRGGAGCYKDRETAEREALRCQFDLIAHHCNGGWKWDGKSDFTSVRYNYTDRDPKFDVYSSMSGLITSGEILFKSYEAATLAIKIFGQDNLKKMNGIS